MIYKIFEKIIKMIIPEQFTNYIKRNFFKFLSFGIFISIVYFLIDYNTLDTGKKVSNDYLNNKFKSYYRANTNKLLDNIKLDLYNLKEDTITLKTNVEIIKYIEGIKIKIANPDINYRLNLPDSLKNNNAFLKDVTVEYRLQLRTESLIFSLESDTYSLIELKKILKNQADFLFTRTISFKKTFSYENLVLFLALLIFSIFISLYLPEIGSLGKKDDEITIKDYFKQNTNIEHDFFYYDLIVAETRVRELYSRSTLLLVAGLIMAFVGVLIFYFTIPQQNNDINSFLLSSIRPSLILIFIESIAWFLLRQYRLQIEDFKVFHKSYLKRTNYFISYKLLNKEKLDKELKTLLTTALLQEDLSGKLKQNESTEMIEASKHVEKNPIFDLAKEVLKNIKENVVDIKNK